MAVNNSDVYKRQVETEDEGKALADYSDTDLIDELYRRRRSTYDPD